jgi:Type IV secretion system pilin
MKKSIRLITLVVLSLLAVPVGMVAFSGSVQAAQVCPDGNTIPDGETCTANPSSSNNTGGVEDPFKAVKVEPIKFTNEVGAHICGNDGITGNASTTTENENEVRVAFDFGCRGDQYNGTLNPVIDIMFAIFRFLSAGVGLVVIGSIIVAGIQYATSAGNPQATQAAIKRISSSVLALLLFMFIFTLANFLVPGGLFVR